MSPMYLTLILWSKAAEKSVAFVYKKYCLYLEISLTMVNANIRCLKRRCKSRYLSVVIMIKKYVRVFIRYVTLFLFGADAFWI